MEVRGQTCWSQVLASYYASPGNWTQVLRLEGKCYCPLSQLSIPSFCACIKCTEMFMMWKSEVWCIPEFLAHWLLSVSHRTYYPIPHLIQNPQKSEGCVLVCRDQKHLCPHWPVQSFDRPGIDRGWWGPPTGLYLWCVCGLGSVESNKCTLKTCQVFKSELKYHVSCSSYWLNALSCPALLLEISLMLNLDPVIN